MQSFLQNFVLKFNGLICMLHNTKLYCRGQTRRLQSRHGDPTRQVPLPHKNALISSLLLYVQCGLHTGPKQCNNDAILDSKFEERWAQYIQSTKREKLNPKATLEIFSTCPGVSTVGETGRRIFDTKEFYKQTGSGLMEDQEVGIKKASEPFLMRSGENGKELWYSLWGVSCCTVCNQLLNIRLLRYIIHSMDGWWRVEVDIESWNC